MSKQIIFSKEARKKILQGVEKIAKPVTITLGPKGRNVGLDKKWIEPVILHDGVSVAEEIELPDIFENFGAKLIRQASTRTNDKAGDGTTTSMLLAWKMLEAGIKELNKGRNPMVMKKGITKATELIIDKLKKKAIQVTTNEQIKHIATVSAADNTIGQDIAQAFEKVGKNGIITVEESTKTKTSIEYKEGMEFDKGYMSPFFATEKEKMTATLETPHILITDYELVDAITLANFLDKFAQETKRAEIVIICPRVDGDALKTLIINKERGGINPLAIFAPSFGKRQNDILEDIAILTGGTFIRKEKQIEIDKIKISELGFCESIITDKDSTKIIGGRGTKTAIEERIKHIQYLIDQEESEFEIKQLRDRIVKLSAGAAIIKVTAMTPLELSDKKERVIDAVEATKSAMEEGIIGGGGYELYNIAPSIRDLAKKEKNKDIKAGINIVAHAIEQPVKKILENAGENVKHILGNVNSKTNPPWWRQLDIPYTNYGYDIATEKYGDLFEMGIIDPVKVTRNAIENAASIVGAILTTEAIVSDTDNALTKQIGAQ